MNGRAETPRHPDRKGFSRSSLELFRSMQNAKRSNGETFIEVKVCVWPLKGKMVLCRAQTFQSLIHQWKNNQNDARSRVKCHDFKQEENPMMERVRITNCLHSDLIFSLFPFLSLLKISHAMIIKSLSLFLIHFFIPPRRNYIHSPEIECCNRSLHHKERKFNLELIDLCKRRDVKNKTMLCQSNIHMHQKQSFYSFALLYKITG